MSEASPVAGTSGGGASVSPAPTKVDPQSGGLFLRAVYEGDTERAMQMIHTGIPVDVSNSAGLQALHFVAKAGHVELGSSLIKHGSKVNAATTKGSTPLHVAALLGQTEVVKLLLRHNADVNARSECNDDAFTPLYMSSQIGHQEIVTLLLAHGADPTLLTRNGSSPRDVASQQGYQVVAEILEEYERRMGEGATDPESTSSPADNDDAAKTKPEVVAAADTPGGAAVGAMKLMTQSPSGRLRTGPPPVYAEAIPSPKHSPLRTRSNRMMRANNGVSKT